jgi:hypothetical protein
MVNVCGEATLLRFAVNGGKSGDYRRVVGQGKILLGPGLASISASGNPKGKPPCVGVGNDVAKFRVTHYQTGLETGGIAYI